MSPANLTTRTLFLSVGSILQKASGILLIFFLVRLLDKQTYGSYQQVFYIGGIVYGLFVSGISSSLYYFIPRLKHTTERTQFVRQTILLTLSLGILSGIFLWACSFYISKYLHNLALITYLKYYSVYIVFWIGSDYFINFLNTYNRYFQSMLFAMVESAVNMLAILLPIYMFNDLSYSFIVLMMVGICRYIVYLIYSLMILGVSYRRLFINSREQIKYSFPLMLSGWADLLGNYIDKVVVSVYYSPVVLAIYAIGTIRIPIWDILVKPVNIVLRVKFAELIEKQDLVKVQKIWREAIRKQAIIILPVVFGLWIIAPPLFSLFFTAEYRDSADIFRIYLLDKPIMVISFSVFPLSMGRSDFLFKGSTIFALSNIVLVFLLLKPLGIYGPISAVVISQYIQAVFYVFMISKYLQIKPRELLPPDIIIRALVANIIPAGIVYLATRYIHGAVASIIISISLYIMFYIPILIKSNLLYKEEVSFVLKKLRIYA
ncbi:MAG: oligosaccharide flippase family protein [Gammaproteobacteria bacterium]|nr:oligosaccharide flippase family protein [Gammaproteobacteria bacterium]